MEEKIKLTEREELDREEEQAGRDCLNSPHSLPNFYSHLCTAIRYADPKNLEKLRNGFPKFVGIVSGHEEANEDISNAIARRKQQERINLNPNYPFD